MLADERSETAPRDAPPEEVTMPETSAGPLHPLEAMMMKFLMNPDNNPILLGVALLLVGICVIASFAMVKP